MAPHKNADISRVVHAAGSLTRVFTSFPTDEAAAIPPGPCLRAIIHALDAAGSPDGDIATVTTTLERHSSDREQIPRLLVVDNGEVLLDELLPDVPLQDSEASFDRLPALIPLLQQRQQEFSVVLLEANAGGGRIRTFLGGCGGRY